MPAAPDAAGIRQMVELTMASLSTCGHWQRSDDGAQRSCDCGWRRLIDDVDAVADEDDEDNTRRQRLLSMALLEPGVINYHRLRRTAATGDGVGYHANLPATSGMLDGF
jgi:hypothetical protein